MRIQIEIIQEINGMRVGSRKNLQPHIASSLIKNGYAIKVGDVKSPRNPNTKIVTPGTKGEPKHLVEAVGVKIKKIEL